MRIIRLTAVRVKSNRSRRPSPQGGRYALPANQASQSSTRALYSASDFAMADEVLWVSRKRSAAPHAADIHRSQPAARGTRPWATARDELSNPPRPGQPEDQLRWPSEHRAAGNSVLAKRRGTAGYKYAFCARRASMGRHLVSPWNFRMDVQ